MNSKRNYWELEEDMQKIFSTFIKCVLSESYYNPKRKTVLSDDDILSLKTLFVQVNRIEEGLIEYDLTQTPLISYVLSKMLNHLGFELIDEEQDEEWEMKYWDTYINHDWWPNSKVVVHGCGVTRELSLLITTGKCLLN